MRRAEHCMVRLEVEVEESRRKESSSLTLPLVLVEAPHEVCSVAQRAARVVRLVCDDGGAGFVRLRGLVGDVDAWMLMLGRCLDENDMAPRETHVRQHVDHVVVVEEVQDASAQVVKVRCQSS